MFLILIFSNSYTELLNQPLCKVDHLGPYGPYPFQCSRPPPGASQLLFLTHTHGTEWHRWWKWEDPWKIQNLVVQNLPQSFEGWMAHGTHLHSLYEFLSLDSINSVFLDHFSSKCTVVMSVQCNPPLQRDYATAYATQRQSIHSNVWCQYGIVKTDLLVRVIAIHSPRVTKMDHLHVSGMCQLLCGYHDP